jgi:hypothetical protein
VRFIFDPLAKLEARVRCDLTLTGVGRAEALESTFARRPDADPPKPRRTRCLDPAFCWTIHLLSRRACADKPSHPCFG